MNYTPEVERFCQLLASILVRVMARQDEALEAILYADHLPAVMADGRFDHRSNHGVQSRAVAAPGEDANTPDVMVTHDAPSSSPQRLPSGSVRRPCPASRSPITW